MKEDFQELIQQVKAMREDLQKGQESSKCDIQLLRADLNKEQGKTEEGNPPKAQGSGMEETLQQLCKEMKAMREDFQKGQESKKGREAEATKPQESLMKEDFKELIQQVKAMREDLQKGQESRKTEEGNPPKAQGSGMEETLQQFCKEMKAMREDFQEGLASTKQDIQHLRADQNKEQGKTEKRNTPEAQGSGMEETLLQFCKQMKTMCEDLQKGQESTKGDIQLLKDLNKELVRNMKKMAKAQESKMDKKFQQLCQRIQTLEQELYGRQGSKQHSLQLLGAETEMEHGVLIESASEDEGFDTDA
ncbi:ribosome-binding protein 1-like isoform X2 [Chiroxiphia lanceolata]|uniref:ribosome-binding protein 1-like isoform X2 n=1 Tax=Chiroxiphia lanceolata TaxID=296741 RepID=UPI0013CE62C6|nr:ribosome-binding protein 1-like isoform X2 [Chiroxiphia lanceolata]